MVKVIRPAAFGVLLGLFGLVMIAPISRSQGPSGEPPAGDNDALMARFERMVRYNLDNPAVLPSVEIDSLAARWQGLPVGDRVAAWARWFFDQHNVAYLYGRDPGGYVSEGRLCQDSLTDCVLFMCRMTELARSSNAREAVQFAFGTRFYGASVATAIAEDGKVNYDDPAHLEYSEDMIRSAIWGADVSKECGGALADTVGSSHAAPDTVQYVPTAAIDYTKLKSGDIVWFIGDENAPGAAEKRKTGTMIHHLGLLVRGEKQAADDIDLIHPASRPLRGVYDHTGVVRLPLKTYLSRVGRFKGIVVTRLVEF